MRGLSWLLGFIGGIVILAFVLYASFVDKIETAWAVAGGVGVLLVFAWLYLDRAALGLAASARGARYTSGALTLVGVGLGLAVAVNVAAHRYDRQWDITFTQRHSLSAQTISVLQGLDRSVTIHAFFTLQSMGEEQQLKDLLEKYQRYTTLITVEWHDPEADPLVAKQYEITSAYGTVVLMSGEEKQRLESTFDEEALTNALIRLASGKDHIVCFVEGHGEFDPDSDAPDVGLSGAIVKLEGQNYTAKKVNLLQEAGVPADCEVLVTAAPTSDYAGAEREMIAAYVAGGGAYVLLIDPMVANALAADMSRYGIVVGNDFVQEQNPKYQLQGAGMSYILLDKQSFDMHPLSEPITGMVVLALARSVDKGPDRPGINVMTLAKTSEYAWAETTLDLSLVPYPDEGKDRISHIPLAAAAEITDPNAIVVGSRIMSVPTPPGAVPADDPPPAGPNAPGPTADDAAAAPAAPPAAPAAEPPVARKAGGRVLVIGDGDFASNGLIDQFQNRDLVLNIFAWLAGEDSQVSIRAAKASGGELTVSLVQGLGMAILSILVAPGVAIAMAIGTWRKRRSL